MLSGRRLKWQLSEPQPEDCTPRSACYQHFNQGKRSHRKTTLWSKGGQNDTTLFNFGLLWRHHGFFATIPVVCVWMLPPCCRRWLWTWLPVQWSEPQVTEQCGTLQHSKKRCGHWLGRRRLSQVIFPAFVFFSVEAFAFQSKFYQPFVFKALWIYLPLDLFPDHFCVCLVLLRTFCARNAGKGCERSAVFYSLKMPPEYFNWSDGKCDLGNVLNAKQPGIYFIKVEKTFENYSYFILPI